MAFSCCTICPGKIICCKSRLSRDINALVAKGFKSRCMRYKCIIYILMHFTRTHCFCVSDKTQAIGWVLHNYYNPLYLIEFTSPLMHSIYVYPIHVWSRIFYYFPTKCCKIIPVYLLESPGSAYSALMGKEMPQLHVFGEVIPTTTHLHSFGDGKRFDFIQSNDLYNSIL